MAENHNMAMLFLHSMNNMPASPLFQLGITGCQQDTAYYYIARIQTAYLLNLFADRSY
jgi:hypothetical protein